VAPVRSTALSNHKTKKKIFCVEKINNNKNSNLKIRKKKEKEKDDDEKEKMPEEGVIKMFPSKGRPWQGRALGLWCTAPSCCSCVLLFWSPNSVTWRPPIRPLTSLIDLQSPNSEFRSCLSVCSSSIDSTPWNVQ